MKRAIITLGPQFIVDMLQLPKGVHVRTVSTDWHTDSIEIMLEGEGLPSFTEHAPGAVPCNLGLALQLAEDGRLEVKW